MGTPLQGGVGLTRMPRTKPPIDVTLEILGREATVARLERALLIAEK